MRVAHVVTYIAPDGAYGGPVRVALGQAAALAERGHEVTVYAGSPWPSAGIQKREGYTLKTFRTRRVAPIGGFATLSAPSLIRALKGEGQSFDVAHIHMARDLVTLPAARQIRALGVPYVVQPHGMIDSSRNPLVPPLDAVFTKPLLRDAAAVFALTDREMTDIAAIQPQARISKIINGITIGGLTPYDARDNVVLYLARLAARKRPVEFISMAKLLRERLPRTRFVLAGPDEGEGDAVRRAIRESGMADRIEWVGHVSPDMTDALLASVRVYVLPAFNEVFPMSILESLRVGTPVVTTDSLGIAPDCERYGAAVITDGSAASLADAVERVVRSESDASGLREGGLRYLQEQLDVRMVAEVLESTYASSVW